MTFGIKSRLIVSHLSVAAIAALSASIYLSISFKQLQLNYQEHALLSSAYALADTLETDFGSPQGLRQARHAMSELNPDDPGAYAVVDRFGLVLAATTDSIPTGSTLSGIKQALSGKAHTIITPGTEELDEHIVVTVPIEHDGKVEGAIKAWLYEKDYRASLTPIKRITALAVFVAIVMSIIISLFLAQALLIPIRKMRQLSKRIAGGNFNTRVVQQSGDELGELAADLNTMALRLNELENVRRDFMGNISHELRSPISNIRVTSEVLQRRALRLGDDSAKLYDTVITETERLEAMVDELLEISAIMAGAVKLDKETFEVITMLEEQVQIVNPKALQKSISITLSADSSLVINADRMRLARAVSNLLENAVKFTPECGRIYLSADRSDSCTTIKVTDTGVGISTVDLPHIFERFYRADKARSSTGGTGIGLAIVKHTAEAHGGTVDVSSTEGQGSCFSIHLPNTTGTGSERNQCP